MQVDAAPVWAQPRLADRSIVPTLEVLRQSRLSVTPVRRLVIAGSFSRAISNTLGQTISHNNTEIYNAQMQYQTGICLRTRLIGS